MIASSRQTGRLCHGFTMAETIIAAAILSMIMAALIVGLSTVQRTFRASQHHAKSQIEQARILDYVGRDIRRARTVQKDTYDGADRLLLTIPDYYEGGAKTSYNVNDVPRTPYYDAVEKRVKYSNADIPITYYKSNGSIFRSVNGVDVPIVSDVQDFTLEFPDARSSEVSLTIKFRPRYSFRSGNQAMEEGTAIKARIFLRNVQR